MRTSRGNVVYLKQLKQLARENRKNPTKAESLVWNIILKRNYLEYGFLRQKPVGRFILDFYSPYLLLAIEIDGDSHENKEVYDLGRDEIIGGMGIKTIRYTNEQVEKYLEYVFEDIKKQIKIRLGEL